MISLYIWKVYSEVISAEPEEATMTETQTETRTAAEIVDEAIGEQIDGTNWGIEGPWTFDDTVFEAADRVRRTLTSDEEERVNSHVSDSVLYYNTLEALRGRPGGRNFVTARLIVAMHWRMETSGLDED